LGAYGAVSGTSPRFMTKSHFMFPCLVIALQRAATVRLRVGCTVAFLLGCAISGPDILALFPVWIAGAAVARQQERIQSVTRSLTPITLASCRFAAAAVLVAAIICASSASIDSLVGDAAVGLATAGMLVLLLDDLQWRGISQRLLHFVSGYANASYSLYAIHLPIVAISAAALIGQASLRWQPTPALLVAGAAFLTVVLLTARGFAVCTEARTNRVRAVLLHQFVGSTTIDDPLPNVKRHGHDRPAG
jgi:peptidoglycan/LPS O-acetylase OafA/YrhL